LSDEKDANWFQSTTSRRFWTRLSGTQELGTPYGRSRVGMPVTVLPTLRREP
jgi:hypothetical protein